MEYAEHQNALAVISVLQGVGSPEDLQEELAILFALSYGSPQPRVSAENISPCDEFGGYTSSEVREPLMQERGESIEVGEGIERPLDRYWPGH
jgi:hypothetical protein